nr:hypothetical protein 26 [Bacillales bacterium]
MTPEKRKEWQDHQRKVILEEYMEHIAIQKAQNEGSTANETNRAMQSRE